MTAFVFKIQANMDPNHRDRIAFARLCSGKLRRGMKAKLVRTGKPMTLSAPQFFFAQDRSVADEAYAGDVVGIPNHGTLRIGDTLTEGEDIAFLGVPNFAPEILRRVKLGDPMKAKKLKEALQQMAEEGVVQVFRPLDGAPALVGVVGPLQLDVLKVRLADEYGLDIGFETPEFQLARWISCADAKKLDDFVQANYSSVAEDLDGDRVFMARNQFILDYTGERAPGIVFTDIKDVKNNGFGRHGRAVLHGGLIHLHIRRLDHRRPARDFAVDAGAEFLRRRADRLHQLRRQFVAHRRLLDDLDHVLVDLVDDRPGACRPARSGRSRRRPRRRCRSLSASAHPADKASASPWRRRGFSPCRPRPAASPRSPAGRPSARRCGSPP